MRITTKGRYGLRAVINLARSNHNRPVSIGSIAAEENVSSEFLEQIFFKLKKAGLIRSVRGPGGGFVLNRGPGEISVQDILSAVGETHGLTPCTLRRKTLCDRPEPCAAHDIWTGLQKTMEDYLTNVTLKDIIAKNSDKMLSKLAAGQDFSI
ncbi:MAG TPA: Rrf2 family transcriptional regulator [Spirochaetia bacterium]|nr:Rrf2 family transcriptional regulator [Spirochaetia bacterium]